MKFSYYIFVHQPLATFAFISYFLCTASLWVYQKIWLWGIFLALSLTFAYYAKILTLNALIPIGFLCLGHFLLQKRVMGMTRLMIILALVVISFGMFFHAIPGFNNWQLSKDPTLYLNYDKPLVGFFALAFTIPLFEERILFKTLAIKTLLYTIIGGAILFGIAMYYGLIKFHFSLTTYFPIWLLSNFFLTTIPEEAFFRGFLQKEIYEHLGNRWAAPFSILVTSLAFAMMHLAFFHNIPFVALSFFASLLYGTIYQVTQSIESSIFCHFVINVIYFTFLI